MFPSYHDVTSRISESPTWYTMEGYPRYGEYKPGECDIYCRYSALMKIACQDCGRKFLIGEDFNTFHVTQFRLDTSKISPFLPNFNSSEEFWVSVDEIYAPPLLGEDGNPIYRTLTIEQLVHDWGYGDPPSHGCVGDTTGSISISSVEVWDRNFGRVLETFENDKYQVIKEWGQPVRLTELENYQFPRYDWYQFYDEE